MNKRTKKNTIRIIAGQWRGRKLPVLEHDGLRPTTDRVRETLFNWLMHDIAGASCLDLFAGTGVLGMECLSRGAREVQFVEYNAAVADAIRQNLQTLEVQMTADITRQNALGYLQKTTPRPYDIVFLDPPFQSDLLPAIIAALNQGWLSESAFVYIEQSSGQEPLLVPSNWILHREGKAGQSRYFLYACGILAR